LDAALGIAAVLELTITLLGLGVRLPPQLLVAGMSLTPLAAAVADHLRVFGIGNRFVAMIFPAPAALAFRLMADALVGAELGRLKQHLTVAATTTRQAGFLRIEWATISLRKSERAARMENRGTYS
jgi:hypothetical protein